MNLDHISAGAAPPEISTRVLRGPQWTPEVHELGKQADATRVEEGPHAGRAHSIVDMRPAYQSENVLHGFM